MPISPKIMHWIFIILFFLIASLYASVGFGGGSSYIALLSLNNLPVNNLRALALACNLTVVSLNVAIAWHKKHISWINALLISACSIPFTFLGAQIQLPMVIFTKILGITLILSALALFFETRIKKSPQPISTKIKQKSKIIFLIFGMFIGFLAGLTGIGGGIFLSPLLYLYRPIADLYIPSLCSIYIWINSLVGLATSMRTNGFTIEKSYLWLLLSVLLGAIVGNFLKNLLFSQKFIRNATAILLIVAAVRLLLK